MLTEINTIITQLESKNLFKMDKVLAAKLQMAATYMKRLIY